MGRDCSFQVDNRTDEMEDNPASVYTIEAGSQGKFPQTVGETRMQFSPDDQRMRK